MHRIASRRPSPAMIVALIALFVALGGTVYAAGKINGKTIKKGTIPGNRIKGGSLTGGQIKAASLTGAQIRAGSLTGAKVAPNSLTGAQIDEGSLGEVPNASALGGVAASAFPRIARDGSGDDAIGSGSPGSGTAAQVTITAPQDGFLLAIASAAVHNSQDSDAFQCILEFDGVEQGESRRGGELHFPELISLNEEVCATNMAVPADQGEHDFEFNFSDLDNTTVVDEAELDVVFIPLPG